MLCPYCKAPNDEVADACFTCGRALFALTRGTVLSSRYDVIEPLGRGGMGMVYKAHDRVLDEDVAIKVLRSEIAWDAEMVQRLRTEIRLAHKVSHRNVCRIHEYGEDGALRFISMELVEGANLKDVLRRGTLSFERAFEIALQIAEGLQAVHEQGIIHRDLKTSNVMIDARGVVRLMDFGIAKEAGSGRSSITASGHILGTPEYMSPEQARGESLDFRSDVYSLGCVVYEVFAARPPLKGETPAATILKHLNEAPLLDGDAAASIPASLRPVLGRALLKDAEERFASAADFAAAVRDARAQAGEGEPVEPARAAAVPVREGRDTASGAPETATLWRLRPRGPGPRGWAGVAAGLAVAAALFLGALRSKEDAPSPRAVVTAAVSPATTAPVPSRPVARVETAADVPRPAVEPGRLMLLVVPKAEVTIDGTSMGFVDVRHFSLAPGPHVLRVHHPDYQPLQRKVTIRSRVESKLVLDLAEKAIPRSP